MEDPVLQHLAETEAGQALAALGFSPEHQGGGQYNFTRVIPGTWSYAGAVTEIVCSPEDGDAPLSLLEPVEIYRSGPDTGHTPQLVERRMSLADWLAP